MVGARVRWQEVAEGRACLAAARAPCYRSPGLRSATSRRSSRATPAWLSAGHLLDMKGDAETGRRGERHRISR
jgi:hypothetical protein